MEAPTANHHHEEQPNTGLNREEKPVVITGPTNEEKENLGFSLI